MSESDDKYPEDTGRRRFVKGVVGGAALAGVGATGSATINSATASAGAGGGNTQAMAIENTAGPAPRGMPQVPLEIDSEGFLRGVYPEVKEENQGGRTVTVAYTDDFKGSGKRYSIEWFQYCGVEGYEGLQPSYEGDNYFYVGSNPAYDWMSEKSEGDRLHVDDFSDYQSWGNGIGTAGIGKPATAEWRSQDTDKVMPVQIVRSPVVERRAADNAWLDASTSEGFIAWLNKCTHFCCVPGWKQSADAAKFGDADHVYCQCHQSLYDPFNIVETLFVARPRPD